MQFFSQSAFSKIAAVGAVAVPLVLVFGYLYMRVSGKSLGRSMFQVYSVLQDTPGTTCHLARDLLGWHARVPQNAMHVTVVTTPQLQVLQHVTSQMNAARLC